MPLAYLSRHYQSFLFRTIILPQTYLLFAAFRRPSAAPRWWRHCLHHVICTPRSATSPLRKANVRLTCETGTAYAR